MTTKIKALQQVLINKKIPALLVTTPSNFTYLTGHPHASISEREGTLIITQNQSYLLCSPLIYDHLKTFKGYNVISLAKRGSFTTEITSIVKKNKLKSLCFESENLTHNEFDRLNAARKSTKIKLDPKSGLIEKLRQIKDSSEISHIKKACFIAKKAIVYLKKTIKPGTTEKHLAWLAEKFMRDQGAESLAFPVIIASGPNSSIPHHTASSRKIKKNDIIVIDIGCKVNGYCSDMTRTLFIGKLKSEQLKVEKIVKTAYQTAIKSLKTIHSGSGARRLSRSGKSTENSSEVITSEIDQAAREVIQKANFGKYFPHSSGHGLGLDIHEKPNLAPNSKDTLKPNMVVTIEPAIYLPGKFGYRHENTILITKSGPHTLT